MTTLVLRVQREGDRILVRSPVVGVWITAVREGQLVNQSGEVGHFEILGRRHRAVLDGTLAGRVVRTDDGRETRRAVGWDEVLFEVDPNVGEGVAVASADESDSSEAAHVFRAPSSGRFYSRPDPEKAPFVSVGAIVEPGQPICMLEVMKTYSRVRYDGDRARVVAVVPDDQDDLEEGDVILELGPV